MLSLLSIGGSGMQAHQRALDITTQNIANSTMRGAQPVRAVFTEQPGGGVQAGVAAGSGVPGTGEAPAAGSGNLANLNATELATETVDAIGYRLGFEMSARVVKTADQLLDTLVKLKG